MIIIKDIQYITDIEKLKVISDPLRISILTTLGTEKKNSKELAKLLKINRTKIHYHLNILEENSFIEVVDTDTINGIIQKYKNTIYRLRKHSYLHLVSLTTYLTILQLILI